eukprot:gene1298-11382_t
MTELKNPTIREMIIFKMDKLLKPTGLSFEQLEQKYGDETKCHVIVDLKGVSIWFNPCYMDTFNRNYTEYLSVNFVDILTKFNESHPFTTLVLDLLQNRPKELKFEASVLKSPVTNKSYVLKGIYKRLDTIDGEPFGYIAHVSPTLKEE